MILDHDLAASDDVDEDLDDVDRDGQVGDAHPRLRRIGLPIVTHRTNPTATVHRLPGEDVSLEDAAVAVATREKYQVGWADWCAWCELHHLAPYDAEPADVRRWLETLRQQVRRLVAGITSKWITAKVDHNGVVAVFKKARQVAGACHDDELLQALKTAQGWRISILNGIQRPVDDIAD